MLLVGDGAWGSGDGGAFVLKLAGGFPVCFFRVNFGYDRETASITRCRYAARARALRRSWTLPHTGENAFLYNLMSSRQILRPAKWQA